MKILLSPAKQMKEADDIFFEPSSPLFPQKTRQLLEDLGTLSYDELKSIFRTSDKVTRPVYEQYQKVARGQQPPVFPALFAYSGIAYQYMAPGVLDDEQIFWLQDHLLILSGLYGLVRPLDPIMLYRLEMHCKIPFSLYDFWGSSCADAIPEEEWILNLASAEYSRLIRKYRPVVDVRFEEETDTGYVEKGVYAKMARGRMVRFCAENRVETPEQLQTFTDFGYRYDPQRSSDHQLVFVRPKDAQPIPKK